MAFVSEREIQNFRSRAGQSGQGVIEYVLILIVVVSIILGGMYQLSEAFKGWANNYFGEYLTCLLETGELPTLGSSQGTGECAQLYKEFSIADGRPLVEGSDTETGSPRDEELKPEDDSSSSSGGSSAGSNNDGPNGVASGSSSAGGKRFRARRGGAAGDADPGIDKQTRAGPGAVGEINSSDKGRPQRFQLERGRNDYARRLQMEDEEEARARRPVANTGSGQKSGSRLIPIDRKIASDQEEPEIEGFTFGGFLRYLLIGAIIIALLIFFGGQILQASKNMQ